MHTFLTLKFMATLIDRITILRVKYFWPTLHHTPLFKCYLLSSIPCCIRNTIGITYFIKKTAKGNEESLYDTKTHVWAVHSLTSIEIPVLPELTRVVLSHLNHSVDSQQCLQNRSILHWCKRHQRPTNRIPKSQNVSIHRQTDDSQTNNVHRTQVYIWYLHIDWPIEGHNSLRTIYLRIARLSLFRDDLCPHN